MAESPGPAPTPEPRPAPAENPLLAALRRPRVILILLGAWSLAAAASEMFLDGRVGGPLGGLALSGESIPLAALYLYCARAPERYGQVFWLALIQQATAIVANVYHWGADDLSLGSIVIPVAVAAALLALVFLHLFQPRRGAPAEAG